MTADRINKEHIEPTLKRYRRDVLTKIAHRSTQILGSGGKKPTSGDIDLGLDTDLKINELDERLNELGVMHKVSKGFNQIWTSFDQYDEAGNIVKDGSGRDKTVQIDLMLGNPEWMEFSYWSPDINDTEFTAHHRSALLAAIIRYAEEKHLDNGNIQTHVINWGSGVWTKERIKYISQRGKNKGTEQEKQVKSKEPVIITPIGVAEFLSKATGTEWTVNDMKQPFEILWDKTQKSFSKDVLKSIAEYAGNAINKRNGKLEVKVFLVPKVITDILD